MDSFVYLKKLELCYVPGAEDYQRTKQTRFLPCGSPQPGGVRRESHHPPNRYDVWFGQSREVCETVREPNVGVTWGSQRSFRRKVMGSPAVGRIPGRGNSMEGREGTRKMMVEVDTVPQRW